MGSLFSYSLVVSVFLAVLYPVMRLAVRTGTDFRFNRKLLLASLAMSLSLPLLIEICPLFSHSLLISTDFGKLTISETPAIVEGAVLPQSAFSSIFLPIAIAVYIGGICFFLTREAIALVRLYKIISSGEKKIYADHTLCLLSDSRFTPFSWGRYIILSSAESVKEHGSIYLHEKSHVAHQHWIDVIIADLVCTLLWYNPFAWQTRRLIKLNHEFEADRDVIESGIEPYQYQQLILETAINRRILSVTNSFCSNKNILKMRVMNIKCHHSTKRALLIAVCAIPALATGILLTSLPASSSFLEEVKGVELSPASKGETVETPASTIKGEHKLAEFKGGLTELYNFLGENIRYPEGQEDNVTHNVVVSFVVATNGEVKDINVKKSAGSEFDKEAMRIIQLTSGKWIPAEENGKAVESTYNLPIHFKTVDKIKE